MGLAWGGRRSTTISPLPAHRNRNYFSNRGYNRSMQFAILAMRVLEVMFFTGLVGSCVVVVISFIEDGKELFGGD